MVLNSVFPWGIVLSPRLTGDLIVGLRVLVNPRHPQNPEKT